MPQTYIVVVQWGHETLYLAPPYRYRKAWLTQRSMGAKVYRSKAGATRAARALEARNPRVAARPVLYPLFDECGRRPPANYAATVASTASEYHDPA